MNDDLKPLEEADAHNHTLMYSGHAHHDGRECGYHPRLDVWIAIAASFQNNAAMECTREHRSRD